MEMLSADHLAVTDEEDRDNALVHVVGSHRDHVTVIGCCVVNTLF